MPELLPDQINGIKYIKEAFVKHKGFLLADRMGLGKTAQAINLIKTACKKGSIIIIIPAYLLDNWLEELKFWGVKKDICVIDSGKQIIHNADIYITSYSLSVKDNIRKQMFKKEFSLLVCDEAHYLKGWNTLRSRYILGTRKNKKNHYSNRSKRVLLLTGTPILGKVDELYNLVWKIAPSVLPFTRDEFIHKFAAHIDYTPWGMKHYGVRNEGYLKDLIKPVFLSRQIIEGLPDRQDIPIIIKKENKELLKEENLFLQKYSIESAESLQQLKQNDISEIANIRRKVGLFKVPFLLECLNDIQEKETGPIIVYTYYRDTRQSVTDILKTKYKNKKIVGMDGGDTIKRRMTILKRYKNNEIDILVTTIHALKEGENLIQGNIVMFLELDWTPANIEQAIARLHRKGQDKKVFVYFFYTKWGIDSRINALLNMKRNIIKKVIA